VERLGKKVTRGTSKEGEEIAAGFNGCVPNKLGFENLQEPGRASDSTIQREKEYSVEGEVI